MEVMDEPTLVTFLWRLTSATEADKVQWRYEPPNQYQFGTRIGRFAYVLVCRDRDDDQPFEFSIHRVDEQGKLTPMATWSSEEQSTLTDPLEALYREVKRRTLGYHTLVNEIFEDLASADGGSSRPTAQSPRQDDAI